MSPRPALALYVKFPDTPLRVMPPKPEPMLVL
jgi:hypothetical protein